MSLFKTINTLSCQLDWYTTLSVTLLRALSKFCPAFSNFSVTISSMDTTAYLPNKTTLSPPVLVPVLSVSLDCKLLKGWASVSISWGPMNFSPSLAKLVLPRTLLEFSPLLTDGTPTGTGSFDPCTWKGRWSLWPSLVALPLAHLQGCFLHGPLVLFLRNGTSFCAGGESWRWWVWFWSHVVSSPPIMASPASFPLPLAHSVLLGTLDSL